MRRDVRRAGSSLVAGAVPIGPGVTGRPVAPPQPVPNNVPRSLSSFVGRAGDLDTIAAFVRSNRLVTLVGPGGAGKTRLAERVAVELAPRFPDGVWWVDLAAVGDPSLVAPAVSRAVGLPEDRADRLGGLAHRLGARRTLLVLDNCEHLAAACAETAVALLASCPGVSILVTSRAPLNVGGEVSWQVPPLSTPDHAVLGADDLLRYDAVALFEARAAAGRPGFRVTAENAVAVAEICARLDGLPLAIELAAARCRVLSPAEVLDGLRDAMGLLDRSRQRMVAARHQTIEASIRWSYALLSDDERRLLARVAVFAGAFTVDAARAVVADDRLPASRVLDGLEALVDQSLVHVHEGAAAHRLRLLETVRQFARRELDASGETATFAAAHAAHFAGRARALWPLFDGDMSARLDAADADYDDLAAMLGHLERHADPLEHAEVAMACLPAIGVRRPAEATALAARVVARVDPATVLGGRLHLRLAIVDPTAPLHVELGVAAARATGDPDLVAHARFWSAWTEATDAPTPANVAEVTEARDALGAAGEDHFSRTHWVEAGIERAAGRVEQAEAAWRRAVATTVCRRCNVMVWSEGALLALGRGDLADARAALARAEALAVEIRDAVFLAHVRLTATEVAAFEGAPWPRAVVGDELRAATAAGQALAVGYLSEARALGMLTEGAPAGDVDDDLARAIDVLEDAWPKRTEARLRRAASWQAAGDAGAATSILEELRALAARWTAGPLLRAKIDHRAAGLALDAGDAATADDLVHAALTTAAAGPWPPVVIAALELVGTVAIQRESFVEGVRLIAAAQAARERIGLRAELEPDRMRRVDAVAAAQEALGLDGFAGAFEEGRQLGLEDAVAYASRARGERKRPSHGWDGLTPAERAVADLAIAGLTNAQIARELFVGTETVKTHLSSVYSKVGVSNRTQLVADAARSGITPRTERRTT